MFSVIFDYEIDGRKWPVIGNIIFEEDGFYLIDAAGIGVVEMKEEDVEIWSM